MRSARYFAADHGIRLPPTRESLKAAAKPEDAEDDAVETPPSRGGGKPKADWFLHDDRDEDPSQHKEPDAWDTRGNQTGWESRRESRTNPGDRKPGYTLPLVIQGSQWQYIDPEGKQQGPFDAKKLLNWVDLGYFGQTDLQVRQQGNEEWGPLVEALPKIRQQAAGDAPDEHDRAKEPLRNSFNRNSDDQPRGRGRGRNFGRGRRFQQEDNDLLPVMPEGKRHPAEALLSPREEEEAQPQRRNNRRGADPYSSSDQPSRGRGRGGRGGGRGAGRDQDQAASSATSSAAARVPTSKAAWNLFTADSRSKADEPKWKYIDPEGNIQGPFSSKEMHQWWEGSYLQKDLPICGMDRQLASQDIPTTLYKPLGQLLRQSEQGQRFRPVQQSDLNPPAPQQPDAVPTPAPASAPVPAAARVPLQLQPRNVPRQRAAPRQAAQPAATTPQGQGEAQDAQPATSAAAGPAESTQKAEPANSSSGSSNDDAESVVARSKASGSESDEEDGEIRGRTAATDEDSDDEERDKASAAPSPAAPPAQSSSAHIAEPVQASPSPALKPEAQFAQASSKPAEKSIQASASSASQPAGSSPTRAAQPTGASPSNAIPAATSLLSSPTHAPQPAQASASTAPEPSQASPSPASASPQRPAASAATEAADIDAGFAKVSDVSDDDDESAGVASADVPGTSSKAHEKASPSTKAEAPPTTTSSADKAEREADGDSTQGNAVQIEEVSQAEAEAAQAVEGQQAGPSSPHKTDSIGLMQSVVDAARSLLSSKPDEEEVASSQHQEENGHDLGASRKSFVVEPETSESEGTASIANSDDRALDQHDSSTEGRDIAKAASFHSVDQDVTDLQTGMQNVTIEEPAEDTAEDSAKSHASPITTNSPRHHAHADAAADVDTPTE